MISTALEPITINTSSSTTDNILDAPNTTIGIEDNKDPDVLLNQLSTATTVVDSHIGMSKKKKIIVIWSILTWFVLLGISAYVVISTFMPSDFTDDLNANLLSVEYQ